MKSRTASEHAEAEHMLEQMAALDPSPPNCVGFDELIKAVSHHASRGERCCPYATVAQ
jgi:hypothetical protein